MSKYDSSWDRPHAPSGEADWQESDCYWFYDAKAGVGGFHRIGQKPNRGTGQLTLLAFATGGSRYAISDSYTVDRPLSSEDRWKEGHQVARHRAEAIGDGRMRYSWKDEECAADLEFYESFYTPRGWSRSEGRGDAVLKNMNPGGHLECSGRIRGNIRIGLVSYSIDALAHRDRSWGYRDHSHVSYHAFRMCSGTVGPQLSYACFILNPAGSSPVVAGFVVRDGVENDVVDLNVLTTVALDGVTMLAAESILTLDNGEKLRVPCRNVQALMTYFPEADAYVSDNIAEVTYEGTLGFCDMEVGINPRRGTLKMSPEDAPLLAIDQGLSVSVPFRN